MGYKAKAASKVLQQVPGASVVGDVIGGAVKNISPSFYDQVYAPSVLDQVNVRSRANPGAFSTDWKAGLNDGTVKNYFDNKSKSELLDLENHFKAQELPEQADLADLYGRAAMGESEANYTMHQMKQHLQEERLAQTQVNKRRRVAAAQKNVDLGTVESPAPQKQVRAQSTELLDSLNSEVQGEEAWAPLRQAGREDKGLTADLIDGKGQNVWSAQRWQGLAPHHLSEKAFDLKAIQNWSRGEQLQFVKDMNFIDVFPGNHPRNWVGAYHDNTLGFLLEQKKAVNDLRKEAGAAGVIDEKTGKPYAPLPKRTLDDWYKADAHVPDKVNPEYGKAELESKDPEIRSEARDELMAGTIKRNWSEILPPGKTIKDIKASKPIISRDHQEFIHGIVNRLESTLRIKRLIAEGKWDTLPYQQRFVLMATNAVERQNVAFNILNTRIQKLRTAMGKPKASAEDIIAWMSANPQRASSIGWHAEVARGGDLLNQLNVTVDELTADLKPKELNLVSNVFGMEQPPVNSSGKLQQWIKENINE